MPAGRARRNRQPHLQSSQSEPPALRRTRSGGESPDTAPSATPTPGCSLRRRTPPVSDPAIQSSGRGTARSCAKSWRILRRTVIARSSRTLARPLPLRIPVQSPSSVFSFRFLGVVTCRTSGSMVSSRRALRVARICFGVSAGSAVQIDRRAVIEVRRLRGTGRIVSFSPLEPGASDGSVTVGVLAGNDGSLIAAALAWMIISRSAIVVALVHGAVPAN